MLGYLEQMPLYNASNFSWAVVMGPGWPINSTVSHSVLNVFICPSDGLSPVRWPTCASIVQARSGAADSTTTLPPSARRSAYPVQTDTTGVFTQGGKSYRRPEHHRRDLQYDRVRRSLGRPRTAAISHQGCRSVFGMGPVIGRHVGRGLALYDVNSNPAGVMTDLQTCQTASTAPRRLSR